MDDVAKAVLLRNGYKMPRMPQDWEQLFGEMMAVRAIADGNKRNGTISTMRPASSDLWNAPPHFLVKRFVGAMKLAEQRMQLTVPQLKNSGMGLTEAVARKVLFTLHYLGWMRKETHGRQEVYVVSDFGAELIGIKL